jgi:hypothetical protein
MHMTRRDASATIQRLALGLLMAVPLLGMPQHEAAAQGGGAQGGGAQGGGAQGGGNPGGTRAEVRLFRVMTMREDLVLGLMPSEIAALGSGPEVDVLARHIVAAGQLSGWRYVVGRAPDGGTRLAARDRVAVLRQDALMVEPYRAALPVLPPPN